MSDRNQKNVTVRKTEDQEKSCQGKADLFTILVLILLVVAAFCTKALSI